MSARAAAGRICLVTLPRRVLAARARGGLRGDDFYEAPRIAVEPLLAVETRLIWEPAGGLGAISGELIWTGRKASSAILHAWFVWSRDHSGPPTVGWLR
jgi:hypothetical protein